MVGSQVDKMVAQLEDEDGAMDSDDQEETND